MPARPSDEELVRACQAGDREAFDRLVERHMKPAYALAYRLTGSHPEADDLAQEAFIRAWRSLARFGGEARFSTWLARIVISLSRNPRRPGLLLKVYAGLRYRDIAALGGTITGTAKANVFHAPRNLARRLKEQE